MPKTLVNQLIMIYDLDLKKTRDAQVKDVLFLQQFLKPTFDWQKLITGLEKKKNGTFYNFRITTLFEAKAFEQKMPGGKKNDYS